MRSLRWLTAAALVGGVVFVPVPTGASQNGAEPPTYPSALSPADIARLSSGPASPVIVLLANQHPEAPASGGQRQSALAADQQPIVQELQSVGASSIHPYGFLNGIAATTTHDEVVRLQANTNVSAVVPDLSATRPPAANPTPAPSSSAVRPAIATNSAGTCPSDPSKPILEPEALQTMNVNFGPGATQPAANDLANGHGVKVAVFPDGLDPNIPDFVRGGHSVIFDYRDFTGSGTASGPGFESFGDASALISQGNQVFDLSQEVNPAHPLPPGCNIRIQGVAPGADLAVLKVFGTLNSPLSIVLQGLEWAVTQDHVDVLSESLGTFFIPNPGIDPLGVFAADAVAAGITVVAATGDSGATSGIASPGLVPGVIAAGATTTFRLFAQTTRAGFQLGGGTFQSNQIAGLSSGGFSEIGPRTVGVVAPGDSGWIDCSNDTANFPSCANNFGGTQLPIAQFGGTSYATPLIAGVAALVIQAYRDTHAGATPAPALVAQIIDSSAQHLNSRADLQGAGLVDGLRAVRIARSIHDANGSPAATGQGLLYSTNGISLTGATSTTRNIPITITNTGTTTQKLDPVLRVLGSPTSLASGQLTLNPTTDPTFIDEQGNTAHDVHQTPFTVAPGTDQLTARIAWLTAGLPQSNEIITLFDPSGRMVANQGPQGTNGFIESVVHDPAPGTWTLLTFDDFTSTPYQGQLQYDVLGSSFANVSNGVVPSERLIPPGGSAPFSVIVTTPQTAGTVSESVVFGTPAGDAPWASIPVSLRSTIPVHNAAPGSFAGTLTGGDGRKLNDETRVFQFDVPPNMAAVNANVTVAADGYFATMTLVDPNQMPVDQEATQVWTSTFQRVQSRSVHASVDKPMAGRWTLILTRLFPNSSLLTSVNFTGTVDFTAPPVSATGIPAGTTMTAGHPVNATIHLTNGGNSPEVFSVDPRLNTTEVLSLFALTPTSNLPLPGSSLAQFLVGPFTTRVDIAATSTVPITISAGALFGFPQVIGSGPGNSALATLAAPDLPSETYFAAGAEIGPFVGPAPSTTYSVGGTGTALAFDRTVTSSTGNFWSDIYGVTSNTWTPVFLQPGQSADISVTFTPQGASGTTVSGFLELETISAFGPHGMQVVGVPYSYHIA